MQVGVGERLRRRFVEREGERFEVGVGWVGVGYGGKDGRGRSVWRGPGRGRLGEGVGYKGVSWGRWDGSCRQGRSRMG